MRINPRREPSRLAPFASVAPATLRPGERPTGARVVRRHQLAASLRRLAARDPFHLDSGRFVPPRVVRGTS
jgi:hypothetical protein